MVFSSLNKFEIYNFTSYDIKNEINSIKKYVKKCLKEEKVKGASFNIILTTNKKIKELNTKYRNIEKETDVISFALEDEKEENFFLKERVLGDIYISVDKAKSQSEEYGHSLKRELSFLAVHGLLHLLGYDHMKKEDEEIMFKKQEMILDGKQR
ncbi:MAG: rRNA maturation RNase YbeY [Bacilli bacterium]